MKREELEKKHVGVEKERGERDLQKGTSRDIESVNQKRKKGDSEEFDW
jgi:hypothetical protein